MSISDRHKQLHAIQDRLAALADKRRKIFSQPADKALDLVLDFPQPAALVHSFPKQDLYLLVQEIGPEDAFPLLALASDSQREFIFDMETWEKDRFAPAAMARWLQWFLGADPARMIPWLVEHKTEFLELFLFKSIEVRIREHDQDPSDFGPGYITHDDLFYVRILDPIALEGRPPDPEDPRVKAQHEVIFDLLQRLALWDHSKYQAVLLEAMSVIPSESEEEEYRLRSVRLAEEGFLPFDEAIGIYQPLEPQALEGRLARRLQTGDDPLRRFQVPGRPVDWVDPESLFGGALEKIEPGEILYQVQAEFASLCNQVIVADQRPLRDSTILRHVVKKVCGYLSIGLDSQVGSPPDSARAASLIRRYPLADLFRVGFGRALGLKWRAGRWLKESWFRTSELPLTFWDESWTGILGGLLIKRPLCYDPAGSETMYREFETSEDIRLAAAVLDNVIEVDGLLAKIEPRLEASVSRRRLSYKNLLLTLWARDTLGLGQTEDGSPLAAPLPLERFRDFFKALFPVPAAADRPGRIPQHMKSAFLSWLELQTGIAPDDIGEKVGVVLETLFEALEEEYGRVAAKDLDPRFVPHFILSR